MEIVFFILFFCSQSFAQNICERIFQSSEHSEHVISEAESRVLARAKTPDKDFGNKIMVEFDRQHQTAIYYPRGTKRIHRQSVARMLVLHSLGAMSSRALSMRQALRVLTDFDGAKGSMAKMMREQFADIRLSAEAVDFIGSGDGPSLDGFPSIKEAADWLASLLIEMKRQSPDIPIFILAKSGTPAIASETNIRHPGLIAGLIFDSATEPGNFQQLKAGSDRVLKIATEDETLIPNIPVLDWSDRILSEVHWAPEHFTIPTLNMIGGKDREMTAKEIADYQQLAQTNPLFRHIFFPDSGHGVLGGNDLEFTPQVPPPGPTKKELALPAWQTVFRFIQEVLDQQPKK